MKTLGGHPLRFVILLFTKLINFRGTPLVMCDFVTKKLKETLRGTPLAICDCRI